MNAHTRIIHDLNNAVATLERHLAALGQESEATNSPTLAPRHVRPLQACVAKVKALMNDFFDLQRPGDDPRSVTVCTAPELVEHLQLKIAPTLTTMYAVDVDLDIAADATCKMVVALDALDVIADNLAANASRAGATTITIAITERQRSIEIAFRDNGCGMPEELAHDLGLGASTKAEGNGHGFRIVRKLAADCGAVVRPPKSIVGVGTEIVVALMKVGSALRSHKG